MSTTLLFTIVTAALYMLSTAYLFKLVLKKLPANNAFNVFLLSAIVLHGITIKLQMFDADTLNLSFYKVSSLIFCVITTISLASIIRKHPIENLLLVFLPLTSISLLLAQFMVLNNEKIIQGHGLISHIVLSIIAYSLITVAALQALMLGIQESLLRKHQFTGLFSYFPPLQTMESLLFNMISIGFVLLSASIVSGFYFFDDMFEQHLAHKTFFSITAWGVFLVLIIGHYHQGWRGKTAVRWTIAGFLALMLAYFGSKLVLEIILS